MFAGSGSPLFVSVQPLNDHSNFFQLVFSGYVDDMHLPEMVKAMAFQNK